MLREKPGGNRLWGKPPGKFPSLDSGKTRTGEKQGLGAASPSPEPPHPLENPCPVGLSPFLLPKGQSNKRGEGGRERSKRNFFQLLGKRKALFRQEEYPVKPVTKQPTAMCLRDRQGTKLPRCPPTAHQEEPAGPGDRGHHEGLRHPAGPELPVQEFLLRMVASLTQASLFAAQGGFLVCSKAPGFLWSWCSHRAASFAKRGTVHFGQLPAPTDTAGSYGQSSQAQATPSPEKLNSAFRFSVWEVGCPSQTSSVRHEKLPGLSAAQGKREKRNQA